MCTCAWDKDKNMWGQLRAEKRPGEKKEKKETMNEGGANLRQQNREH